MSGDETAMETPIIVQLHEESRLRATTNERDNTCAKKKKRIRKCSGRTVGKCESGQTC